MYPLRIKIPKPTNSRKWVFVPTCHCLRLGFFIMAVITFGKFFGMRMTQTSLETYVLLYFRSIPDNILTKIEEEVLDLAKTYPQAIALLEPVREFCLHMKEQSEKQLKAMAIELGLGPFMYDPDVTESNIGYEATRENMAEIQAIIGMVEEGYQFILKTPM